MYTLYLYLIFICHMSFYCIYRHYVSQRQTTFQFIMYIEYGNKTLLLYYKTASQIFLFQIFHFRKLTISCCLYILYLLYSTGIYILL